MFKDVESRREGQLSDLESDGVTLRISAVHVITPSGDKVRVPFELEPLALDSPDNEPSSSGGMSGQPADGEVVDVEYSVTDSATETELADGSGKSGSTPRKGRKYTGARRKSA